MIDVSLSEYLKSLSWRWHDSSYGHNADIYPGQWGEDEKMKDGKAEKPGEDTD